LNVELFKKTWKAHRIVWIMHFGEIPEGMLIDHINGVGTDNRVSNLRLATRTENGRNAKKRRTSKSKYKGVSWRAGQGKWNAVIQVDGVRHHIASFDTELEAHKAYCEVAEKIFGEFFNNGDENE
jgi:diaminopimelate decarboxylase